MLKEGSECRRLDIAATISLSELEECCGMSADELKELEFFKALTQLGASDYPPQRLCPMGSAIGHRV